MAETGFLERLIGLGGVAVGAEFVLIQKGCNYHLLGEDSGEALRLTTTSDLPIEMVLAEAVRFLEHNPNPRRSYEGPHILS